MTTSTPATGQTAGQITSQLSHSQAIQLHEDQVKAIEEFHYLQRERHDLMVEKYRRQEDEEDRKWKERMELIERERQYNVDRERR